MQVKDVCNEANNFHWNTSVSKCGIGIHNRDHYGKLVCNNETKCDKDELAKERAMCYIVTTDLIF